MKNFFDPTNMSNPFVLFSREHLLYILAVLLIVVLMYIFRNTLKKEEVNRRFRYLLIGSLIIAEGSLNIWRLYYGEWTIQTSLPLHLCGISIVLSIIMLLTRNYLIFELTYFWGLIGAFLAIITPALEVTYSHYRFWQFMSAHALIVFAVIYMVFVEGYRPGYSSIWKTFLLTNILMVFIAGFNWLTGANYLYLCEKPLSTGQTLFDFLGPWPWYILVIEVLAVAAFHLWYLPCYLERKVRQRPGRLAA